MNDFVFLIYYEIESDDITDIDVVSPDSVLDYALEMIDEGRICEETLVKYPLPTTNEDALALIVADGWTVVKKPLYERTDNAL